MMVLFVTTMIFAVLVSSGVTSIKEENGADPAMYTSNFVNSVLTNFYNFKLPPKSCLLVSVNG